ncbi:MAG: carboxypeptidase regulatory-like domain-containing protein [Candidatus Cloacimonadales bacterium]
MNTTTKAIIMILIITFGTILNAIPENELVTYPMSFPMRANPEATVVVGGTATTALVWTEESGVELLAEGNAEDISADLKIAGVKAIRDENDVLLRETAGYWDLEGNFTEIGSFPDTEPTGDGNFSTAYAVSEDGNVFAGMGWVGPSTVNAFKWTEEDGIINLNPDEDQSSRVNALNADGSMAVGWMQGQYGRLPVYWDLENEMHEIPNNGSGEAMGVSPSGEYFTGSAGGQAFLNIGEDTFYFGETGMGWNNIPNYVNDSGLVVGAVRNMFQMVWHGFVYNQTMGMVNANEYFETRGVEIPDNYEIQAVSWVSEDNKTFVGWVVEGMSRTGFIIKLSASAVVSGQIAAPGAEDLSLATISNGVDSTHPDAEGNYTLMLEPGTHTLTVNMPGYYTVTSDEITVETGEAIENMDFALEPISDLATVSGTVSLLEGIGNVTQVLVEAGDFSTHPDEDGYYELYVEAGDYDLTATLNGFFDYESEISLSVGEEFVLDIELIGVDADNTVTITVAGNDEIDHSKTRIYIHHDLPGDRYFQPNSEGVLQFTTLYIEDFSISVISDGYESQFIDNLQTIPLGNVEVDFTLEKLYHPARDLVGNSEGEVFWTEPYALDSYVEDFESYDNNDPISLKNPMWTPFTSWPAGIADAMISDEQVEAGSQSLKVSAESDVITDLRGLLLGDPALDSGAYEVNFDIFIPTGYAGHYNLIRALNPLEFSLEVFFRTDGMLKIHHSNEVITDLTFEHDQWLHVSHQIDLDEDSATMYLDGEELVTWQFSANAWEAGLGTLNLDLIDFSGESDPEASDTGMFYLDNFAFSQIDGMGPESYDLYLDDLDNPLVTDLEDNLYAFEDLEEALYTFGVVANYANNSSQQELATFEYISPEEILPPTNLNVTEDALVSWDAPQRELSGYNLYLNDELLAEDISETEYQLVELAAGTYTVAVSAIYNGLEESELISQQFEYDPVASEAELVFVNELKGNYPNPFNPTTNISFSVAAETDVSLKIYNSRGQVIKQISRNNLPAGEHNLVWNGRDDSGKEAATGVYFYQLESSDFRAMKKMILMK